MNNLLINKLEWDSNHFGFNIASLNSSILDLNNFDSVINECDLHDIRCIYCLINPNNLDLIDSLSKNNFRFIDIRVLFHQNINKVDLLNEDRLEIASLKDIGVISNWAESFHQDSRFFKDKNFDFSKVQEMYNIWVNKFFDSEFGAVIVYKENNILLGYIIVSIGDNKIGKIELIGVSENYRGMGYGKKLINLSIKWFKDKGVDEITVVTQASNISAIRLYSKAKFLPYQIDNWYHYWSSFNK